MRIDREGPEAVGELEPLWLALREHHGEVAPELGPLQTPEESWRRRRADYVRWLEQPDSFVLVARDDDGHAVGYALVVVHDTGGSLWTGIGSRLADVETLSVLPEARGDGVGKRLLDAAAARARELGIPQLELTVVASNADARRFYEREGFFDAYVVVRRSLT